MRALRDRTPPALSGLLRAIHKRPDHAIFTILEVILVLAVFAVLHVAIVVHEFGLTRGNQEAVPKPSGTTKSTS